MNMSSLAVERFYDIQIRDAVLTGNTQDVDYLIKMKNIMVKIAREKEKNNNNVNKADDNIKNKLSKNTQKGE